MEKAARTRQRVYRCTRCDTPTARDLLMTRRVSFNLMGEGGRLVKSRTSDWLCPDCLAKDVDFTAPKFKAPGMLPSSYETAANA